jgi:type IV secretory pathway VirB6-like protein
MIITWIVVMIACAIGLVVVTIAILLLIYFLRRDLVKTHKKTTNVELKEPQTNQVQESHVNDLKNEKIITYNSLQFQSLLGSGGCCIFITFLCDQNRRQY